MHWLWAQLPKVSYSCAVHVAPGSIQLFKMSVNLSYTIDQITCKIHCHDVKQFFSLLLTTTFAISQCSKLPLTSCVWRAGGGGGIFFNLIIMGSFVFSPLLSSVVVWENIWRWGGGGGGGGGVCKNNREHQGEGLLRKKNNNTKQLSFSLFGYYHREAHTLVSLCACVQNGSCENVWESCIFTLFVLTMISQI